MDDTWSGRGAPTIVLPRLFVIRAPHLTQKLAVEHTKGATWWTDLWFKRKYTPGMILRKSMAFEDFGLRTRVIHKTDYFGVLSYYYLYRCTRRNIRVWEYEKSTSWNWWNRRTLLEENGKLWMLVKVVRGFRGTFYGIFSASMHELSLKVLPTCSSASMKESESTCMNAFHGRRWK